MKGFTLIEIVVTLAIFLIILVATLPVGFRFFSAQNIDDTTAQIVTTLRQAQSQSITQKNDRSFGVAFLSDSFVLFQGTTYTGRDVDQDISTPVSSAITISGVSEITFGKGTGLPSFTGVILIQQASETRSIQINQQGLIELL